MLQVTDRFWTQDGEWYVSNKPYSITQEMVDKYHIVNELGGATHIYVRAPKDTIVCFVTSDGKNKQCFKSDGKSWVNQPMFASSAYNSEREVGPWSVWADHWQGYVEVASGIGLPNGWHVSTFLVVEDVAVDVPAPTEPEPEQKRLQVLLDGAVLLDKWV